MRIRVAVGTLSECKSDVARLVVRSRRVAAFARHLGMKPGQREACLRMVELPCRSLPIRAVVALCTVRAKPSVVRVLMTTGACLREPEERAVQVANFDQLLLRGCNVLCVVTAFAAQALMFALEHESGLLVVESGTIEFHDREVAAIVLRVASCTLLVGARRNRVGGVQSAMGSHALADFRVALDALKDCGSAAEGVAVAALRGTIQGLVCARERARRNLCGRAWKQNQARP